MNNSASKKFDITQLPTDPSQITSHTLTDTGMGGTLNYLKCGKLIFGIWIDTGGPDEAVIESGSFTSADRIAFLLGTTVNTLYATTGRYNADGEGWNGATWATATLPLGTTILAILLN